MDRNLKRANFSSGSPWEPVVGYSRAVKVGGHIWIAGTTAIDSDGNVVGKNDPGLQTTCILNIIRVAIEQAGAGMENIVRTRIYVKNIGQWEEIGRAHGAVFDQIRPATTMVEVSRLVDPDMLVEIEAEAFIGE